MKKEDLELLKKIALTYGIEIMSIKPDSIKENGIYYTDLSGNTKKLTAEEVFPEFVKKTVTNESGDNK